MMFFLGLISGILLLGLSILIVLLLRPKAERTLNQLESKLKPKGSIIEPEDNLIEEWVNNLNDE